MSAAAAATPITRPALRYHGGKFRLAPWVMQFFPPHLFRAQGFPEGYVIHVIPDPALLFKDGKQAGHPLQVPRIPLTATAQVRMCGNSVSPPQAEALVRSNFGHEASIYERAVA